MNDRQHGSSGVPQADVPTPSLAEQARTLLHTVAGGTLATISQKHDGYPFGSVMPYAVDEQGAPICLISNMAMHTKNLVANPRATLLVQQPAGDQGLLGAARVSVMGDMLAAGNDERASLREPYLARNPDASYWVDFEDFSFFRMRVIDVYYIGGFGVMGWITAQQYSAARPDPLADAAAEIIDHMNQDHAEALIELARHFGQAETTAAHMSSVDRLGFDLRITTDEGPRKTRIAFLEQCRSADDVRHMLIQMLAAARG